MRIVLGFVGSAVLFLWVWLLVEFGRLPARIPTHFDGAGTPDRWTDTSAMAWFGPAAIGLFVVGMLVGSALLVRWMAVRHPGLVNIPNKDDWIALPPHLRAWSIEPVVLALALSAVLVVGLFACISWATSAVASGQRATAPMWPVWALVALMLAMIIGSVVLVTLRVRYATRTQ